MDNLAPIIVFAYNRPEHLRRAIEALAANELAAESILYVYCDGPRANATEEDLKNIREVRAFAHSIQGFRDVLVVEQPINKGLDPSEIEAITEIVNKYGKVISVEDDLITNRYFLRFINEGLDFYESDKRIYSIAGFVDAIPFPVAYKKDIFASYRAESCGWGTWADRWNQTEWDEHNYQIIQHPTKKQIRTFNRGGDDMYPMLLDKLNGRTDAWDIRWAHTMYMHNGLCIRPTKSLIYNIGFDGTGVHSGTIDQSVVLSKTAPLYDSAEYDIRFIKGIKVDKNIQKSLQNYFRIQKISWWHIFKRRMKNLLHTIIVFKER